MRHPFAFQTSDLDPTVSPADDFCQYAIGGWLRANPIPDDYSRWGIFELVTERNNQIVRSILEDGKKFVGTPDELMTSKVAQFYRTAMDEATIERVGAAPLASYLAAVDSLKTLADCVRFTGQWHRTVASPLFHLIAAADAKQSDWVIAGLVQGGLGLPERDYYLGDDERSKQIRRDYLEYMTRLLTLLGVGDAMAQANQVLAFETKLAEISTKKEDMRDPVKNYNKMTLADVQKLSPAFDWSLYFVSVGLPDPGPIDVGQLAFFRGLNDVAQAFDLAVWQAYFRMNLLRSMAAYLSEPFVAEHFRFYGQVLSGQKQNKPRWKRMVDVTENCFGQAIGKLFVRDYFSPIAKARAEQMVAHILSAMGKRIERVEWMSAATKVEALKKLHGLTVKIGYPDRWIDFSPVEVTESSLVENVVHCSTFLFQRELDKIGKAVDKTEWLMYPQMVNAYFEPSKNEIVFPAGILQPPFFDETADDAMNYGGIGSVIGHEITHAFDDQGRQYDATGNLRDWWTADDEKRFKVRAQALVEQFNHYSPLEGAFVNGAFTLGENIADLGGLEVALDAFMAARPTGLAEQGTPDELIDGFTPVQRFFLSYAQVWKTAMRDEKARLMIMVDTHSPAKFRTIGPLSNMSRFFEAYQVPLAGRMFRPFEERVVIW